MDRFRVADVTFEELVERTIELKVHLEQPISEAIEFLSSGPHALKDLVSFLVRIRQRYAINKVISKNMMMSPLVEQTLIDNVRTDIIDIYREQGAVSLLDRINKAIKENEDLSQAFCLVF